MILADIFSNTCKAGTAALITNDQNFIGKEFEKK